MRTIQTKLLLLTVCAIGINACGSEATSSGTYTRRITPTGDGTLTTTSTPTGTSVSVDLNIAKNSVFQFNFPDAQKADCIVQGGKADWKITSETAGLILENSALCEVKVYATAAFAAKVTLQGKYSGSDSKEFTYIANMTPGTCAAGLTEAAANADGSIQCVQAIAATNLCIDDLALATISYNATTGAQLLFRGSSPSDRFKIDHNCEGSPFKKVEFKLATFSASQKYVTKGHIQIKGRSATIEYNFCIDPTKPSKLFISPVQPTTMPTFADLTIFGVATRIAYFRVDANSRAANAAITMTNVGVRHGETVCGAGFSTDSAYQK